MTKIEIERRNRIRIAVAAYAYEFENMSIITDAEFDNLAMEIDTTIKTNNKLLDNFFKNEFTPFTGMWIYKHPHLYKIKEIYNRFYKEEDL